MRRSTNLMGFSRRPHRSSTRTRERPMMINLQKACNHQNNHESNHQNNHNHDAYEGCYHQNDRDDHVDKIFSPRPPPTSLEGTFLISAEAESILTGKGKSLKRHDPNFPKESQ